ncbi:AAA family ATPase [Pseudomonas sp. BN415]|uniref:ATP-binding protein n=1 Tax=Pseudomonas sp. BN415 TaxID=2567889 RepID=UPI0024587C4F|nr:ATP-binding protein [Pseudomonas sp. BN415]MDH4581402.1 AAA family ATPase [Pseudomonas sp. BN415]
MALTVSDLTVDTMEAKLGVLSKHAAKCDTHGDYIARVLKHSEKPTGCPVCADEAQKVRDQEQAAEDRAKASKERLERRLGAAMIPPRFAGKDFSAYRASTKHQREVLAVCAQYAEGFREHYDDGRCLLLVGNVGTGKTHLASAIADHIIRQLNALAVYRTLYSLMQYVKGSFDSQSGYTEAQAYENLIEPHLLIIDEIGATKQTEFEQATLFNVINGRYEQKRPTLVISNLMPDELEKALGDRVMDRLRENAGLCLVFDWGSARKGVVNG